MITNHLLKANYMNRFSSLTSIRTKVYPVPAKFEYVHGRSQIGKPAAYEPVRLQLEKGKSYAWCACGASSKQPFCDGSHKKLNAQLKESEDKFEPHRFVCEETRTVLLCMCKSSSNRPFCDETHSQLSKKTQRLDIFEG